MVSYAVGNFCSSSASRSLNSQANNLLSCWGHSAVRKGVSSFFGNIFPSWKTDKLGPNSRKHDNVGLATPQTLLALTKSFFERERRCFALWGPEGAKRIISR